MWNSSFWPLTSGFPTITLLSLVRYPVCATSLASVISYFTSVRMRALHLVESVSPYGRLQIRFPFGNLEIFRRPIHSIRIQQPRVHSACNRNEHHEISLGSKLRRTLRAVLAMPNAKLWMESFFMFGWPCVSNYVCIINQHDTQYIFSLLNYHASTSFGPICNTSSGGQVYNVVNGTCLTVRWINLKLPRYLHSIVKYIIVTIVILLIFSGSVTQRGLWPSRHTRLLDHTQRRARVSKTPLERVISSSQRPLPDNTQHPQQTNIYAPGGIEPTIAACERP
jgi:hypothetical protein